MIPIRASAQVWSIKQFEVPGKISNTLIWIHPIEDRIDQLFHTMKRIIDADPKKLQFYKSRELPDLQRFGQF